MSDAHRPILRRGPRQRQAQTLPKHRASQAVNEYSHLLGEAIREAIRRRGVALLYRTNENTKPSAPDAEAK
jgi:hypothetical protein